ncbi:hypothetical protein C8R43DRAFT_885683 [Mycena crocata]|nr:hypothetical protein C8R43DRAFT_885683 [Mycena crocata]
MNKSQFYLSQCADAASKSTMYHTLGAAIVKGGKVISTGYNHQRPNYDTPGNGTPMSMHAEMTAIFKLTRGRAPALKQQVQPRHRTATPKTTARKRDSTSYKQERCAAVGAAAQRLRVAAGRESRFLPEEGEAGVLPVASLSSRSGSRGRHSRRSPACGVGVEGAKQKGGRPRYTRLNGADLYVARVTKDKHGFGCSKPCWRCVEWCAWAGIRRIFHWSVAEGRFVCLKVGGASEGDVYQTVADFRYLAGTLA